MKNPTCGISSYFFKSIISDAYLRLDFGTERVVYEYEIYFYNIEEDGNKIQVQLGLTTQNYEECQSHSDTATGYKLHKSSCNGIRGRFFLLTRIKESSMKICDVKVYGTYMQKNSE